MAIGNSNNVLATRIQLKSDTETNWLANSITPLLGEIIIYTPDANHSYSRLKVGDGQTNVTSLPFIDAGSINGDETFILKYANFDSFPSPGEVDKLYVDLSTSKIYHYAAGTGYTQLANFNMTVSKSTIRDVVFWGPGSMTNASVQDGILTIRNGVAPQLLL